jgi:predicted enzyme related to lactoylglutathione lyase
MRSNLGYYTLPVRDVERGKAFYGAVLGWSFESDGGHAVDSDPPGGLSQSDAEHATIYFRVDDIQSAMRLVREHGGHAEDPREYPSGWSCNCRDDQGTHFSLWEPSEAYR